MSRLAFLLALVPALVLAPVGAAAAQTSALAGAWTVSFAVGVQNDNGVESPVMGSGTLTITAHGDSLIAILAMQPPDGSPARPPARMAAKFSTAQAIFVMTRQASVTKDGETTLHMTVSTFALSARGDALSGTVLRKVEGMDDFSAAPQPVTGTRTRK